MDSGWRIYMEDAHINNSPLSDKKNSIFGVFDGHGGFDFSMQVHKFRHLWNAILSNNLKEIRITKRKITKKHLKKLSLKWISFCSQKQAKNRSSLYKNKWEKKTTDPNTMSSRMLAAQLTSSSLLLNGPTVRMQLTQEL
jgi:serine/threonine protein phosphatase PrpC